MNDAPFGVLMLFVGAALVVVGSGAFTSRTPWVNAAMGFGWMIGVILVVSFVASSFRP